MTHEPRTESPKHQLAKGEFEVKLEPLGEDDAGQGAALGRMSIDKQFSGDLDAAGKGQMLTALSEVKGSAVYVAIERVTGTLHGRTGSFVLTHRGTMTRGDSHLSIAVVPDSGAGQLAGISGWMRIEIREGRHFYEFEYLLPAG